VTANRSGGADQAAAAGAAAAWDRFAAEFVDGYCAAHPTWAAAAGRHEFDGQLPDFSREGLEGEARRLSGLRRRALEIGGEGGAGLDAVRRRNRELVLTQIDGDLFWLEDAEWPARNPLFYAAALDPSLYVNREYAPASERARAFARFARQVPAAVSQVRGNLRRELPATVLELGVNTFGGLVDFCRSQVPALFAASVDDGALLAEVAASGAAAADALGQLAQEFATARAVPPDSGLDAGGFQLGEARFARMLHATERIDVPLGDIAAAGRRDLERNLAALTEACARLAKDGTLAGAPAARAAAAAGDRDDSLGRGVAECVARVQGVKPAGGPVAAARRQLELLRRFVAERELVSIPGDEEARVEEAPPHLRWNSAFIEIPGPYDRHLPSIYFIAPPDASWSAAEREAYLPSEADLLFISAHEVWPGHFLQFLHSNRAATELSRLYVGYAFAEGWAHYSEEMMWEAGFGGGDPAIHVGQLQNALLRNVRLLVAIGLHTGEMTLQQAEAMFLRQGLQDTANARQQAARATFDPAYLNYTLGKLVIQRLRQDWLAAAPGRSLRQFHDSLLSFGGPPLPLVRAAMLPEGGALRL
jgi:Bacterial protein of unknown function (DUF885)